MQAGQVLVQMRISHRSTMFPVEKHHISAMKAYSHFLKVIILDSGVQAFWQRTRLLHEGHVQKGSKSSPGPQCYSTPQQTGGRAGRWLFFRFSSAVIAGLEALGYDSFRMKTCISSVSAAQRKTDLGVRRVREGRAAPRPAGAPGGKPGDAPQPRPWGSACNTCRIRGPTAVSCCVL